MINIQGRQKTAQCQTYVYLCPKLLQFRNCVLLPRLALLITSCAQLLFETTDYNRKRRMLALGIFLYLVRVKLDTWCIRWYFIQREASRIQCVGKMKIMQDENKIYEYLGAFPFIISTFYTYSSRFSSPFCSCFSKNCYPASSIFSRIFLLFPLFTSSFQLPF